jgi:hypothetical protein
VVVPTFQRNLVPPSSWFRVKVFYLKMEAEDSFKTFITTYQTTKCHDPRR